MLDAPNNEGCWEPRKFCHWSVKLSVHFEYKVGFLLSQSSAQSTSLPSSFAQVPGPVPCQEEPSCSRAALTGALVCPALLWIQPGLPALVSVDLCLISFEKGDRIGHEGLALIFIFRQIFTTLNNYQGKEASAVNKLWTRNSNTIKIQTVRSGDCKGSVNEMHRGSSIPSLYPSTCLWVPSASFCEKLECHLLYKSVWLSRLYLFRSEILKQAWEIVSSFTSQWRFEL